MQPRFPRCAGCSAAVAALLSAASFVPAANAGMAEVVFSHPPQTQPVGGPASDSLYNSPSFGPNFWQLLADDFALSADATVHRVRWWGFHGEFVAPVSEDFRIRFREASGSNGLPGGILAESINVNVNREATGRTVVADADRNEYVYEADLTMPFSASTGQNYWIEIAQLGNVGSRFRWEFGASSGGPLNGHSYQNPVVMGAWTRTIGTENLAFELLSVPEPASALIAVFAFGLCWQRRMGARC